MGQDGSLEISFNEWRDFLLYAPYTNIHDLIRYWRHSTRIFRGLQLPTSPFGPTEFAENPIPPETQFSSKFQRAEPVADYAARLVKTTGTPFPFFRPPAGS
ncbi:Mitochondrial carrier protein [Nesidiocoris tenuis]|uniref:Mitochondrial carrier protein n=1 Tax=Nesidiocoris tenuis TaxID=355587 RepID=A0ABN7B393_9HEMI|nr:Mitochondrial carrier protein [Nesidiocoris tenuis]